MDEEFNFEKKKFWKQPKFFIRLGLAGLLASVLIFGGKISGENSVLGNFSAAVYKTFEDVLGFKSSKPIYELDLTANNGNGLAFGGDIGEELGGVTQNSDQKSNLERAQQQNQAPTPKTDEKNSITKQIMKKDLSASGNKKVAVAEEKVSTNTDASSTEKSSENIFKDCSFSSDSPSASSGQVPTAGPSASSGQVPTAGGASRAVTFNEIAWMGSSASANDEWMEIKNNSSSEINLAGWQIKNKDESIKIVFGAGEKISVGGPSAGSGQVSPTSGFFLLERTDDNSVPNIPADKIYSGVLSNSGEWLKLFDSNCNLVDEVNATVSWESFGGDNISKKTLERNNSDLAWRTSAIAGGTPRAKNSEPVVQASPVTPSSAETPPPVSPPPAEQPTSTPTSTPNPPPEPPVSTSSPQAPPLASVKILISEVMAGSSSSSDYEFIEIYNYGSEPVDLTGWTIKKKNSKGGEDNFFATKWLNGQIVVPGKYFLLANIEGYTGTVSADVKWPKSSVLAYTNNSITICNASGALIDQVSWAEIPKDKSYSRASLDISAGFAVSDTPSPQNSQ